MNDLVSRKKHSFTMLEVIVALLLISMAAPILFGIPFKLARRRIDLLFRTELQRQSLVEWGKWQAAFYREDVGDKNLKQLQDLPCCQEEKEIVISFAKELKRKYRLTTEIVKLKCKQKTEDQAARLLHVKIAFISKLDHKESSYVYALYSSPIEIESEPG